MHCPPWNGMLCFCCWSKILQIHNQQESPPAWTQEAYRPPRSKCSLCWGWGGTQSQVGGYPSQVQGGVPHPRSGGGVTRPRSRGGTLSQVWGGVQSQMIIQTWLGGTHPDLVGGYPGYPPQPDVGWGTPPWPDLGWGTPQPDLGWDTPPRPDWGTPPPRCGLTNKLKTVPSPILRMRAVNIYTWIKNYLQIECMWQRNVR